MSSNSFGTKTLWSLWLESDSLREFAEFLRSQNIDENKITRSIRLLRASMGDLGPEV